MIYGFKLSNPIHSNPIGKEGLTHNLSYRSEIGQIRPLDLNPNHFPLVSELSSLEPDQVQRSQIGPSQTLIEPELNQSEQELSQFSHSQLRLIQLSWIEST